ncbi:MAG: ribonuclease J [Bacilli bacterium]
MSKIKIFALGGMGENGKNMYGVEIGNDIILFDAGFKYPDENMYGIDTVVPDFTYLKENKERIKGIFISHGHMDNVGAINDFVTLFPNVTIHGSSTTISMVNYVLEESNLKSNNMKIIDRFENVSFGKYSVFAIPLTHSAPGNFGYAVNTKQGIIFYATDYIFDHSASFNYSTDIGKIAYLGKQGVLCLLTESLQAQKSGHTSPEHRINDILSEYFESAGRRAFVMIYSSNYYRIQEVLTESKSANRKVVIYGKRLTEIVNNGIKTKVFNFDKKDLVSIFNLDKHIDEDLTIIVSGERDRPFSGMDKIVKGNDNHLKLTSDDSVLIAASPVPNTELEATKITDDIYRTGASVIEVGKKQVRGNHASKEDVLLMLELLKPKYLIPIKGEYRHQTYVKKAAISAMYDENNILMLDNGNVAVFENKKFSLGADIKVGDVLVDGNTISEGEVVLKDRELLKENGIIIVSCALNFKNKKIVAGPEVVTRGFIHIQENREYIELLKNESKKIITTALDESATYNEIQKAVREQLSLYIYDEKGRRPMIITMLQTL